MNFFDSLGTAFYISSISLLCIGVILYIKNTHFRNLKEFGFYLMTLFSLELLSKQLAVLLDNNNLIIFSISSFTHFSFLSFIYFKHFFKLDRKWFLLAILIGIIPLLFLTKNALDNLPSFQSYDRAIYSSVIVLYCLRLFHQSLFRSNVSNSVLFFNVATLLFFSLDVFLAVTTNFLIHADLPLVSWFWSIRALFLQTFYLSIIYFLWKHGKTLQLQ